MTKKINYLPVLLSGVSVGGFFFNAHAGEEKPNIVIIVADDLGTNELGCYGGTNLRTPNIDKLASEGIRLTNNYASCAMSVPVRASMYTGLYPVRHGSFQNHKNTYPDTKSVTHYLSALGYRVGRTGKNHPVNQPTIYGFEKIDGFTVLCTASKPKPATTNGIREFIERNDNEPFCLYVCSIHPHAPWDAGDAGKFSPDQINLPPNVVDNEKTREDFCKYLAEIQVLDDEVGKVMKTLEETGKLDNTIVIFLGEQGPQIPYGKWTCYRYGQHSAFIARYPSKINAGTTSDAIVQYEDILPSMIEIAGGEPIRELDGKSCLDVLFGEKAEHREWAYGIHNNIPAGKVSYPIRSIQDKRYKLILNLTPQAEFNITAMMNPENTTNMWASWLQDATTDSQAKFLTERFVKRPAVELYDLQEDPWELKNIAERPEHADRIRIMKENLEKWMKQQGDRGASMDVANPDDPVYKTPVAIADFNDFNTLVRNDLSGSYYLENDIILPEGTEWIPIGANSPNDGNPTHFKGVLDGRGYAIKNLKISAFTNFKGLFGRLNHAVVKNFTLEVDIKGNNHVGGVSGAAFAETTIENVSVSGSIQGNSEVGGMVGRISFDPNYTGYNTIRDCYVDADIVATGNHAGGIAGYTVKNGAITYGKVEINNVYVNGKIRAPSGASTTGNAAGLLSYTEHPYVKMHNCAVLCSEISGSTPNYFYSRNVPAGDLELLDKLYAIEGIALNYQNDNDKGDGAQIDMTGKILSPAVFLTEDFYKTVLDWDFETIWYMGEAGYPQLKKNNASSLPDNKKATMNSLVYACENGIVIDPADQQLWTNIYTVSGQLIYKRKIIIRSVVPVSKGAYMVNMASKSNSETSVIIVN